MPPKPVPSRSGVDGIDAYRAHADMLLNAIDNLRGYRCAEQGPFRAHVDATWTKAVEVTTQFEGAVDALRYYAESDNWKGRHSGETPAHADAGHLARLALGRLGGGSDGA